MRDAFSQFPVVNARFHPTLTMAMIDHPEINELAFRRL
jgi:hypothetical protein